MENLPQPFDQEDIRKDPKAVVIGLLIGLLLIFASVIAALYHKEDSDSQDCEKRVSRLYDTILSERNKRIKFYEAMIFYKSENQKLQKQDSLIRKATKPLVNKIYTNYEK
ncbi:hypothetical protein [Riemerella columbipharyngis]|uniref:Uncharacterized protein n=1 Tax=Riemerella columbipharyngis TaxID=1071918 RepID=A0A1G7FPC6_9FLAO|nr:hypothetical protein [Riemerella columbipharyngis]SDE77668.1 hypothetical protein SAMN05421544_1258 [Riemerella columbipharyngis]